MDLFGPMPDHTSILVVQDMVSRFPAAKILQKTDADHVTTALEEIYAAYGTPTVNRTDNGPPFNGEGFRSFLEKKGIEHEKCFPYHPNSNPVETFMKPLGKAMRVAHREGNDKKKALDRFLATYRATPHVATGIAPGDMLLRHGYADGFPKTMALEDADVDMARTRDMEARTERDTVENRTRSEAALKVGDKVMARNESKKTKFDPSFGPEWMEVTSLEKGGITCQSSQGVRRRRHLDDIKVSKGKVQAPEPEETPSQSPKAAEALQPERGGDEPMVVPRRSGRERRTNPKYADYV